jgi:hypothetical protein
VKEEQMEDQSGIQALLDQFLDPTLSEERDIREHLAAVPSDLWIAFYYTASAAVRQRTRDIADQYQAGEPGQGQPIPLGLIAQELPEYRVILLKHALLDAEQQRR